MCGPVRCTATWLQGLPLGQYASMIYKMIEQAAMIAVVIFGVATAPYGPPGYLWTALQPRITFLIMLNGWRLLLACAMGIIMAKLNKLNSIAPSCLKSHAVAPSSSTPWSPSLLSSAQPPATTSKHAPSNSAGTGNRGNIRLPPLSLAANHLLEPQNAIRQ